MQAASSAVAKAAVVLAGVQEVAKGVVATKAAAKAVLVVARAVVARAEVVRAVVKVASRAREAAAFLVAAAPKEVGVLRVAAERSCTNKPWYDLRCLLVSQRGYSYRDHSRCHPHTQSSHPGRLS